MSEINEPVSERCQHCVWSGLADIPTAFVVVDCGRHGTEGVTVGANATANMRAKMDEWADKLTSVVGDVLVNHSGDPALGTLDHDYNLPLNHDDLNTKDVRAIVALLDNAAERIRAYERDLDECRQLIKGLNADLAVLRARVRR